MSGPPAEAQATDGPDQRGAPAALARWQDAPTAMVRPGGCPRRDRRALEVDVVSDPTEAAEVSVAREIGETTVNYEQLEAWREWQRRWDGQLDSELDQPFLRRHAASIYAIETHAVVAMLPK